MVLVVGGAVPMLPLRTCTFLVFVFSSFLGGTHCSVAGHCVSLPAFRACSPQPLNSVVVFSLRTTALFSVVVFFPQDNTALLPSVCPRGKPRLEMTGSAPPARPYSTCTSDGLTRTTPIGSARQPLLPPPGKPRGQRSWRGAAPTDLKSVEPPRVACLRWWPPLPLLQVGVLAVATHRLPRSLAARCRYQPPFPLFFLSTSPAMNIFYLAANPVVAAEGHCSNNCQR